MQYFTHRVHGEFTNFDKWKVKCAVISLTHINHFKVSNRRCSIPELRGNHFPTHDKINGETFLVK